MTALDVRPAPPPPSAGDANHVVCCDPDVALCGTDVSDEPWEPVGHSCPPCPPCEAAESLGGCGARGCPYE